MGEIRFEVRAQEVPVAGWVVIAHLADGREQQLLGVYVTPHFANDWIPIEGANWIRRRDAELD